MVAFGHSFARWTERLSSESLSGRGRLKSCGKYRFLGPPLALLLKVGQENLL